jgi:peptidoglycan/LPS O-acetylase OafA/YrhL
MQTNAQQEEARAELLGLASLRGIAAVCVMFHNLSIFCFDHITSVVPSKVVVKSYLLVDMFFVLSGFVLAHVYSQAFARGVNGKSYRNFMLARAARLYPLHLIILGLLVAVEVANLLIAQFGDVPVRRDPFTATHSVGKMFLNIFMLRGVGHSWNDPGWPISAE